MRAFCKRAAEILKVPPVFVSRPKLLYYLKACNHKPEYVISLLEKRAMARHVPSEKFSAEKLHSSENAINQLFREGEICVHCKDGGSLLLCDTPECPLAYHSYCAAVEKVPDEEWHCPAHFCVSCKKSISEEPCLFCGTNFCTDHSSRAAFRKLAAVPNKQFRVCQDCWKKKPGAGLDKRAFLYRLFVYNGRLGKQIRHVPLVGEFVPDLFKLFSSVNRAGGLFEVLRKSLFKKVASDLAIACTQANLNQLRNVYYDLMYEYEQVFLERRQKVAATWKQKTKTKKK